MPMLFINWIAGDKMIQALCWTLLHSLWQGLLLTIFVTVIITVTRKSRPSIRYNLLAASFVLFIITSGLTFLREIVIAKKDQPSTVNLSLTIQPVNHININDGTAIVSTNAEPNYFNKTIQYLDEHASLIVAIWFIVFSIKLVRMIVNIGYIQHIRHYKTFEPSFYWKQRIAELVRALDIQHTIILLESSLIKTPMIIGMLKPMILVPLGLLSNLPPGQVEAILLHELSHIRREDYLVNLLQSFAEVIFFFNPAIIWISSLIREERENCCDDITIGLTKNKKQFIHALVAFQEYTTLQANNGIAIAFAGRKKYLLNRVKRIIYNENKKLNAMEKGIFIFSIVLISLIGFASVKQMSARKAKSNVTALSPMILDTVPAKKNPKNPDTIPGPVEFKNISSSINKDGNNKTRTIAATDRNGKQYKMIMQNEEPMELYVNDKKISSEEMDNYKEIINTIEEEAGTRQKTDMVKMKMAQAEQGKKIMQLDAERSELLQRLSAIDEERAKLGYERTKQPRDREWEDAATLNLLDDLKMKMRTEDMKNRESDQSLLEDKLSLNQNADAEKKLQMQLFNKKTKILNDDHFYDLLRNYKDALKENGQQLFNDKLRTFQNDALEQQQQRTNILVDPIIQDMVEGKIIPPQQEDLSFELNNRAFIVNGKKQSAEVRDRFREKYLKKEGDYFKYSRKNGSTSTTIKLN